MPLSAATFTVTTNADTGAGSLRAAILSANATPAVADRIEFAIGSGPQTIALASPLPTITDAVTIDATTQPGFAGNPIIELNGAGAGAGLVSGFTIGVPSVTIQGFVINRFAGTGITTSAFGTQIYTNWIGLGLDGTTDLGNGLEGVSCNGSCGFLTVGGTLPGQGNVISGNGRAGVRAGGMSNVIRNNRIGTDATGTVARGNDEDGIILAAASGISIISGNVVSGNIRGLDLIFGQHVQVTNNLVGVGSNGTTPIPNAMEGMLLNGQGFIVRFNTVANNTQTGIAVVAGGNGIQIRQNSIYNNGLLGIDLNFDGVTPNDPLDADVGPNSLQNFPVILSARPQGATQVAVRVAIASQPNTNYLIDFYGNAVCTATDREGQTYISTTTVNSGPTGSTTADVMLTVPAGAFTGITATATNTLTHDTSEFSPCRAIAPPPMITFTTDAQTVNETDGTVSVTVQRTGDTADAATVDYATDDRSATAGQDYTTTTGTLTWAAGDASPRTIVVPILNDANVEPNETFAIRLLNATGATVPEGESVTITIVSDDAPADVAPIPTASEWALLLLAAALGVLALRRL